MSIPRGAIPLEENKRQVIVFGAHMWYPSSEMGGRNVEASMASSLQLRGLGPRTKAC